MFTASGTAAGQSLAQASLHGYQTAFLYASLMLAAGLVFAIFIIRSPKPQVEEVEGRCVDPGALEIDC